MSDLSLIIFVRTDEIREDQAVGEAAARSGAVILVVAAVRVVPRARRLGQVCYRVVAGVGVLVAEHEQLVLPLGAAVAMAPGLHMTSC